MQSLIGIQSHMKESLLQHKIVIYLQDRESSKRHHFKASKTYSRIT